MKEQDISFEQFSQKLLPVLRGFSLCKNKEVFVKKDIQQLYLTILGLMVTEDPQLGSDAATLLIIKFGDYIFNETLPQYTESEIVDIYNTTLNNVTEFIVSFLRGKGGQTIVS